MWANPPFDVFILEAFVNIFVSFGMIGYLLLPRWESQPFYHKAMKIASARIDFEAGIPDLFLPHFNQYCKPIGPTRWPISIFFINNKKSNPFGVNFIQYNNGSFEPKKFEINSPGITYN